MNSIGTHLGYPTISMILYPVRGQWPAVGPECYSVQSVCLSREINVSCIKKTRLARCKLNYLQFATANRRVAPQVVWSPLSVPPADDMNFSGIKSPSDECNGEEGASSQARLWMAEWGGFTYILIKCTLYWDAETLYALEWIVRGWISELTRFSFFLFHLHYGDQMDSIYFYWKSISFSYLSLHLHSVQVSVWLDYRDVLRYSRDVYQIIDHFDWKSFSGCSFPRTTFCFSLIHAKYFHPHHHPCCCKFLPLYSPCFCPVTIRQRSFLNQSHRGLVLFKWYCNCFAFIATLYCILPLLDFIMMSMISVFFCNTIPLIITKYELKQGRALILLSSNL